jgi:hypothetical protein
MRDLIERLCSEHCAGRAPATPGGERARAHVRQAFERAGYTAFEQPIPLSGGVNVLASRPGTTDRWIIVGAHYDHLGVIDGTLYPGADDNAAAVAVLIETARRLAEGPALRRGVLFAAFDAEEPPHFLTAGMGSEHFAAHPTLPLDNLDLMVCMDLIGHPIGPEDAPPAVRDSLFALGAERSAGIERVVDDLTHAEPGLAVHRVDAETVPVRSDYWGFWTRGVPFLFLTGGRGAHYHQPTDTPDRIPDDRLERVAGWLERLLLRVGQSPVETFEFRGRRDDSSSLRTVRDMARQLRGVHPRADELVARARTLLASCDDAGRLPDAVRPQLLTLVELLQAALG